MQNTAFCTCGSGLVKENCCQGKPEVRVTLQPFSDPGEKQVFLEKLQISSQFDMRYRGLVDFYGDDLIAYKQERRSIEQVNEFLRIFAKHLTDNLEEDCPTSWKECPPSFLEELIFGHYPHHMKITTKQNDSEIFLLQLKRFFRWLDQRVGTSWYDLVDKYAEEAAPELKRCEQLLNHLFLCEFPRIHHNDWNVTEDIATLEINLNKCSESVHSVFQITEVYEEIITANDIDSGRTYQITGIPCNMVTPGILINGIIGKKREDFYWTWLNTEGVYPSKAIDYFKFIG